MSFWKKITGLVLLSIPSMMHVTAVQWNGSVDGNWSTGGNWNGGVPPNAAGATAEFAISSPHNSISVDTAQTVGTMSFETSAASYTINSTGSTLSFASNPSGNNTYITVTAGSHTFSSALVDYVTFPAGDPLVITTSSGTTLHINTSFGDLTVPSALTITGSGLVNITNANTGALGPAFITGGTVDNKTTSSGSSTNFFSSIGNDITISDAIVTNSNANSFTGTGFGTAFSSGGSLIITNATVNNINSGNIQETNQTGIGSDLEAALDFISTNVAISNTNTGSVTLHGTATMRGSLIQSIGDFTMNGGSLVNSNSGSVHLNSSAHGTAAGSLFQANNITLNAASIIITNSGEITGNNLVSFSGSLDFGSAIQTTHNFTVNGGSINITNEASGITNLGIGAGLRVKGSFMMNGGTINVQNQAEVLNFFGSAFVVVKDATINSGTIALMNTGAVNTQILPNVFTIGSNLTVGGTLTMNSGLLTNATAEPVVANSFGGGSVILVINSILLNGGTIINDAYLNTPTFMIGPNGTYAGSGIAGSPQITINGFSLPSLQMTNAGTVIPGDPGPGGTPGIMNVIGSYTQTSTGTLVINIENQSSYSQLLINGVASLAGTLEIAESVGANISPSDKYIVLNATGGVNGKFSNLLNFNLPFLMPQVNYFPTYVEISFLASLPKYVNLTQPQFSSLNETHTKLGRNMQRLRNHFAKPARNKKIERASSIIPIEEPSTEPSTSLQEPPVQEASIENVPIELVSFVAESIETEQKRERLTQSLGAEKPWNLYVGPKGQMGNVYSNKDAQGYKDWSAGAFTGFDYAFSEVGVGLLAEYERYKANVGKKWGDFVVHTAHADIYATYAPSQLPEFSVNGIVGGGYQWYDVQRNVMQGTTKGSPRGAGFDSLLGVEYALTNTLFDKVPENLYITPMASIQYMYLHIQNYTEKGASMQNMRVSQQNQKSLRSNLGFRIGYTWEIPNVTFSPELTCSWQREFLDKKRSVTFTQASGPVVPVVLKIGKSGRNIALAGVDFLITMYEKHGLEVAYDFEYNSGYHTHFGYLSYNVRF